MAPPSLQPVNVKSASLKPCGDAAVIVFDEPAITVSVKGVGSVSLPSDSDIPGGSLAIVISAVSGSSRTVATVLRPSASVAVKDSTRYAGYSWSGATKLPDRTPAKSSIAWVWQTVGSARAQWRRISDHFSAEAGSTAPEPSRAEPAKAIASPTLQRRVVSGESIVTAGGVPTVSVLVAVPARPPTSVTRSRTVAIPACVNVQDGLAAVESSYSPSPSRSHA